MAWERAAAWALVFFGAWWQLVGSNLSALEPSLAAGVGAWAAGASAGAGSEAGGGSGPRVQALNSSAANRAERVMAAL